MPEALAPLLDWMRGIPSLFWPWLGVAAGLVLGMLLIWLLRLRPLRRDGERLYLELEASRSSVNTLGRELAASAEKAKRVAPLEARVADLGDRVMQSEKELAETAASLRTERQNYETRLEEIRRMDEELQRKFQELASGALDRNAKTFLGLVSERFEKHSTEAGEDLARRQKAIEGLVKPLQENLGKFETQIGALEKAREGAYSEIRTQVRQLAEGQTNLRTETGRLVQALRAPKTRGRWGEFQLRQVFEMAGMVEHVDFVTEHSITDRDGGLQRPDAIVRLPGGKTIVVDAKTPLDAYLNAVEADTPEGRDLALASHARQLRSHVKSLAGKAYWDALPSTPDFVVMFIPGEAFFSAAVEADPEIFENAFASRVLISTPTTLIALVKSIAYGWQQDKLAKNAQDVAGAALELYERFRVYGKHMSDLGQSLRSATERYNRAVGSLEGRVLPAARKFETLGVVSAGAEMEDIAPVEVEPRELTAAEYSQPGEE